MQTPQVQPTPTPQPRIATTHELMMPYAADLVRMKAKGTSHGQMLTWLHSQGVMVNMGEIASFWPYHALQKARPHQPPQPTTLNSQPSTLPKLAQPPGHGAGSTVPIIGPNRQNSQVAPSGGHFASHYAPVLLEYIVELLDLRDAGKSDAELRAWLRTNKNLGVNIGEITKVFDYYKEYQEEIEAELEQAMECDPEQDRAQSAEPPAADSAKVAPSTVASAKVDGLTAGLARNPEPNENTSDAEKPKQRNEENCPPTASGGLTASAEYDISEVMADYKILVARQVARDKVAPEADPESLKVTERMVRTLIMYKHSLQRREERLETLKIKKADHEFKISKAATATQEEANETVAGRKGPKDFDNTAFIKVMREESLKEANTPEMIALVDKMIMEADAQARAAGMKIPLYVPSEPLPTAQPSPPREESLPIIGSNAATHPTARAASHPVPRPGLPSAQAAPAGAAISADTGTPTASPSGHSPIAQPSPLRFDRGEGQGEVSNQHPAEPGTPLSTVSPRLSTKFNPSG